MLPEVDADGESLNEENLEEISGERLNHEFVEVQIDDQNKVEASKATRSVRMWNRSGSPALWKKRL